MKYILGIDIGGTKTAVAVANKQMDIKAQKTFSTKPEHGPEDLVARIGTTYRELLEELRITCDDIAYAGVASPGPLDVKQGKIVHIATMGFVNVPIKALLEKELNTVVYLENDANCAALAESKVGAGQNCDPVVYVTISTGIGSGIVINGRLLSGACSSAGELGHLTVEPEGRQCPCGKKGCLELYSSGTAIGRDATEKRGILTDAKTAFALARQGNETMQSVINDAADKLGLALSGVIHLIDPEVIVLGGSVTKDFDLLAEPLNKAIKKYTQPVEGRGLHVKLSSMDGAQVLLGAMLYAKGEASRV